MNCKYNDERLLTCWALIGAIYEICPGTGGLAHVAIDDENIDDRTLNWTIQLCNREENKNKPEAKIVILLCEILREIPLKSRIYLLARMDFDWWQSEGCLFDSQKCDCCTLEDSMLYKAEIHEWRLDDAESKNEENQPEPQTGDLCGR